MNLLAKSLPSGVVPTLGPDATGVGHVFWYTVEGNGYSLQELRSLQDWFIRYQLNAVPGVAEVASVGGVVRQYQIDVDPNRLRAFRLPVSVVVDAVMRSNRNVGGNVVEANGTWSVIRGLGLIEGVRDIEQIVVGADNGVPVFLRQVAEVKVGDAFRAAALVKGTEEVVGGVVVARYGVSALEVIERVREKIKALQAGLPSGVRIVSFYDRSALIARAAGTLRRALIEEEAVAQAGIKTALVGLVEPNVSVQVPGVVAANAYREVKVTPLVGGIVRAVHVELGTVVRRGAPLATLFSAELADAQTKYLSMRAMLEADHQRRERTQMLVEIGAASRQELEEVVAVHASHAAEVEAARQRLLLLGLTRKQVDALKQPRQVIAEVLVHAPLDGVVTGRAANLGQVVAMGQELFVVTDLSEVWAIGDLYEQDFQRVRVGSEATLTTPAYPELRRRGHVSYIDPRVEPQTRTAKVRVAVPNADGNLRLGMYVTLTFTSPSGEPTVVVPRAAVQTVGARQVVFVPVDGEEGRFLQRPVTLGRSSGESAVVREGLTPGETVVTEGRFFLRAESLRNAPSN